MDEVPTAEEVWRTIQKREMRNDINWWNELVKILNIMTKVFLSNEID